MEYKDKNTKRAIAVFTIVVCLLAIAGGLSSTTYSNYFKEAYNVTSQQRGFIEIPREAPGILCALIISLLASFSDVKIAILAQLCSIIGLVVMGIFSPPYSIMLIFLFIESLGTHIFIPLNDSIGMSLAREGHVGKTLGHFKSRASLCTMATAFVVFIGYRFGFFSFKDKIIIPFVIAACLFAAAVILLIYLDRIMPKNIQKANNKGKILLRKKYIPYYITLVAYGCQKRIKLVFGPWIIIELLHRGADTLAILTILTSFVGAFFSKYLGRMLDEKGLRFTLVFEGIYLIIVASALGVAAGWLENGVISPDSIFVIAVYVIYVLSYILDQFNMVHAYMMKRIAIDPSEVTESLSVGLALDHIVAITVSSLFGIIWENFGAEYVFYITAATAVTQIIIGFYMSKKVYYKLENK